MKNRSVGALIQIFSHQTSLSPVTGLKRCDLQKQLNAEPYGPNLADVEKQIAAHNILHQAIEAYSGQLTPGTTSSQVHVQVQQHMRALFRAARRINHLSSSSSFIGGVRRPQRQIC